MLVMEQLPGPHCHLLAIQMLVDIAQVPYNLSRLTAKTCEKEYPALQYIHESSLTWPV